MHKTLKVELIITSILQRLEARDLFVVQSLCKQFKDVSLQILSERMSITFLDNTNLLVRETSKAVMPLNQGNTLNFLLDDTNVVDKLDLKNLKQLEVTFYGDSADVFLSRVINILDSCFPEVNLSVIFSFRRHLIASEVWKTFLETVQAKKVNLLSLKGRSVMYTDQIQQLVTVSAKLKELRCCVPNTEGLRLLTCMDSLVSVTFHSRDTPGKDLAFQVDVMLQFILQQFQKKLEEFRLHVCLKTWKKNALVVGIEEISNQLELVTEYVEREPWGYSAVLQPNLEDIVFSCNFTIKK